MCLRHNTLNNFPGTVHSSYLPIFDRPTVTQTIEDNQTLTKTFLKEKIIND